MNPKVNFGNSNILEKIPKKFGNSSHILVSKEIKRQIDCEGFNTTISWQNSHSSRQELIFFLLLDMT